MDERSPNDYVHYLPGHGWAGCDWSRHHLPERMSNYLPDVDCPACQAEANWTAPSQGGDIGR